MPKSPERKRLGIYYTPPEFTLFIVQNTLNAVVEERFAQLRSAHGLSRDDLESDQPSPQLAAYWCACLDALRQVKVCDPACGSGAFLVQAYTTSWSSITSNSPVTCVGTTRRPQTRSTKRPPISS